MLRLPTRTPVEYETNLSRFIGNELKRKGVPSIALLDAGSTLTRYFRTQPEFKPLFENIDSFPVHSMDEMALILRSVSFRKKIREKQFLILAPFYHLFEHHSAWKQKQVLWKIDQSLEHIEEKYGTHVIVAEE